MNILRWWSIRNIIHRTGQKNSSPSKGDRFRFILACESGILYQYRYRRANGIPEAGAEFGCYEHIFISRLTWLKVLVGAQCRKPSDGDDISFGHNVRILPGPPNELLLLRKKTYGLPFAFPFYT